MSFCRSGVIAICLACSCLASKVTLAAGGTSGIASKGNAAHVSDSWPEGTGDLVNDPLRTEGWNSWFTEWPNDVNQYAFDVKSMEDVNKLIEKLASLKPAIGQVRLCYLKEPSGLGWVTQLPEGNKISVVFSIGDQARIDQWFKQVRKPFGAMEFTDAPVAVLPTLTLFVQNEVIDLDKLKIPAGIAVEAGYVPTVFHKSNTTIEQKQTQDAEHQKKMAAAQARQREALDPATKKAADAIESYLEKRKSAKNE